MVSPAPKCADKWLPERPKGAPLDNWDRSATARENTNNSLQDEDRHQSLMNNSNNGNHGIKAQTGGILEPRVLSSLMNGGNANGQNGQNAQQDISALTGCVRPNGGRETAANGGNPLQTQITDLQKQIVTMREQLTNLQQKDKGIQRSDSEEILVQWYRSQREEGRAVNMAGLKKKVNDRPTTFPRQRSISVCSAKERRATTLWDVVSNTLNLDGKSPKDSNCQNIRGKFHEPYTPQYNPSGQFLSMLRPNTRNPESPRRSPVTRGSVCPTTGLLVGRSITTSVESSQSSPSRKEMSMYEDRMALNEVMTAIYMDLSDQYSSLQVAAVHAAITLGIVDSHDVHKFIEDHLPSYSDLCYDESKTQTSLKSITENHSFLSEPARQLMELIKVSPENIACIMPPIYLDVQQFEEACLDVFHLSVSRRLARRAFHVMDKLGGRLGRIELKTLARWRPGAVPGVEASISPRRKSITSPRQPDECKKEGKQSETPPVPHPAPGRLRGSARPWLHGSKTLGSHWDQTWPVSGSRLSFYVQNEFLSSLRSASNNKGASWNPAVTASQTKVELKARQTGTRIPECSFQFRQHSPSFRTEPTLFSHGVQFRTEPASTTTNGSTHVSQRLQQQIVNVIHTSTSTPVHNNGSTTTCTSNNPHQHHIHINQHNNGSTTSTSINHMIPHQHQCQQVPSSQHINHMISSSGPQHNTHIHIPPSNHSQHTTSANAPSFAYQAPTTNANVEPGTTNQQQLQQQQLIQQPNNSEPSTAANNSALSTPTGMSTAPTGVGAECGGTTCPSIDHEQKAHGGTSMSDSTQTQNVDEQPTARATMTSSGSPNMYEWSPNDPSSQQPMPPSISAAPRSHSNVHFCPPSRPSAQAHGATNTNGTNTNGVQSNANSNGGVGAHPNPVSSPSGKDNNNGPPLRAAETTKALTTPTSELVNNRAVSKESVGAPKTPPEYQQFPEYTFSQMCGTPGSGDDAMARSYERSFYSQYSPEKYEDSNPEWAHSTQPILKPGSGTMLNQQQQQPQQQQPQQQPQQQQPQPHYSNLPNHSHAEQNNSNNNNAVVSSHNGTTIPKPVSSHHNDTSLHALRLSSTSSAPEHSSGCKHAGSTRTPVSASPLRNSVTCVQSSMSMSGTSSSTPITAAFSGSSVGHSHPPLHSGNNNTNTNPSCPTQQQKQQPAHALMGVTAENSDNNESPDSTSTPAPRGRDTTKMLKIEQPVLQGSVTRPKQQGSVHGQAHGCHPTKHEQQPQRQQHVQQHTTLAGKTHRTHSGTGTGAGGSTGPSTTHHSAQSGGAPLSRAFTFFPGNQQSSTPHRVATTGSRKKTRPGSSEIRPPRLSTQLRQSPPSWSTNQFMPSMYGGS